jgi:hypothetical protein
MAMISKAIQTVASSGLNVGDAINVAVGVSDYKEARQQGDSRGKAMVKAGASFAWGEIFYGGMSSTITGALENGLKMSAGKASLVSLPLTVGLMMAPAAATLIGTAAQHGSKARTKANAQRGYFGSGYFNMSEAGYTMRQRSINAIQSNKLNTQSVLGNEARTYFRGSV